VASVAQEWPELPRRGAPGVLECAAPMQFKVAVFSLSGVELLVATCDETTTLRELRVRLAEAGVSEARSSKFMLGDAVLGGTSTLLSPFAVDGGSITIQLVILRNYLRFDGLYRIDTSDDMKIFLRFYEECQTVIAIACQGTYTGAARDAWQWAYCSPTGRLVRASSSVEWIAQGSYEINADTVAFALVDEEGETGGEQEFVVAEGGLECHRQPATFLPLDDMEYHAVRAERPGGGGRVHVTYRERAM